MEKTREKSFLNIKSKLMAAVAMLLVAFFMVISSSYAWFTLSTAPEVTGIYTAVGANGNLEIALYTGENPADSKVGDSAIGTNNVYDPTKNVTWGNIVNLTSDTYGLKNVSLLPARLNLTDAGKLNTTTPLQTPVYGADGRINQLESNTLTATFEDGAFSNTTDKGVRAIGTASGMTAQQLAYRNARTDASTANSLAISSAKKSLEGNATALADLMIVKATDGSSYNIEFATSMIGDLKTANANIEKAIIAYISGYVASLAETLGEDAYKLAAGSLPTNIKVLDDDTTGLVINSDYTTNVTYNQAALSVPEDIYAAYTKYLSNYTAINAAETALSAEGLTLAAATWTDVENVFINTKLVDVTKVTINGYKYNELRANMFNIYSQMSNGINVELPAGSGVHVDIAEVCGDYSVKNVKVTVTKEMVESVFPGLTMDGEGIAMDAMMSTKAADHYDINAALALVDAPEASGDSRNTDITDFYGYVIDLAFRTNAAESSLLLQTIPVDRIYTENEDVSSDTMGKGSTMSFTLVDDLTPVQAEKLMSAIRFIFASKDGEILAVGGLTDFEAQGTTAVSADVVLYDFTASRKEGDTAAALTITEENGAYKTLDKQAITALAKNEVEVLSVYVYLDGDKVDNTMVGTGTASMTGTLNLQFSSDATLVPMEYSDLQGVQTEATTTSTTTAGNG